MGVQGDPLAGCGARVRPKAVERFRRTTKKATKWPYSRCHPVRRRADTSRVSTDSREEQKGQVMKTQRTFDIQETAEKARKSLEKLQAQQRPGERTGKGSKTDVIMAIKQELKEMLQKGYTSQQIADAFRTDVFQILPKTITEIVGRQKRTNQKTKRVQPPEPEGQSVPPAPTSAPQNKGADKTGNEQKNTASGSFKIQPDSEDL